MSKLRVRTSAKAVIIRDGNLLAVKNHSGGMDWYILPGGGQRHGESLIDALKRECLEEISLNVIPGDMLFVRDYISRNHEFAEEDGDAHQVEFMFHCTIEDGAEPAMGPHADRWQTGVAWLPLHRLSEFALYPKQLRGILSKGMPEGHPVYLGDVN
jgi:ADP-ribose pyrophosphatase YjhB (NUDIX family)